MPALGQTWILQKKMKRMIWSLLKETERLKTVRTTNERALFKTKVNRKGNRERRRQQMGDRAIF